MTHEITRRGLLLAPFAVLLPVAAPPKDDDVFTLTVGEGGWSKGTVVLTNIQWTDSNLAHDRLTP